MKMQYKILIVTLLIILIILIVGAIMMSITEYENNHPCIEYENVCQKEYFQRISTGKLMTTIPVFKDIDCDSNYDRIIERCVKRK